MSADPAEIILRATRYRLLFTGAVRGSLRRTGWAGLPDTGRTNWGPRSRNLRRRHHRRHDDRRSRIQGSLGRRRQPGPGEQAIRAEKRTACRRDRSRRRFRHGLPTFARSPESWQHQKRIRLFGLSSNLRHQNRHRILRTNRRHQQSATHTPARGSAARSHKRRIPRRLRIGNRLSCRSLRRGGTQQWKRMAAAERRHQNPAS
jgi:hypothetical protein